MHTATPRTRCTQLRVHNIDANYDVPTEIPQQTLTYSGIVFHCDSSTAWCKQRQKWLLIASLHTPATLQHYELYAHGSPAQVGVFVALVC